MPENVIQAESSQAHSASASSTPTMAKLLPHHHRCQCQCVMRQVLVSDYGQVSSIYTSLALGALYCVYPSILREHIINYMLR